MTYLELARSALTHREKSEKSPSATTSRRSEAMSACEISEKSEKRSARNLETPRLTLDEAEQLKARIIAAVTVEPEEFDREYYDALMAEWRAYEATLSRLAAEVVVT